MAAVNEWVVREYFELHGFLANQPRKHTPAGGQRKMSDDINLLVINPKAKEHILPERFVWRSDDLTNISSAIIGIRGGHTERFYASTLEQAPKILSFAGPTAEKFAAKALGGAPMARILCLPRLPVSGFLKLKTIEQLKDKGVDGVISFETMLLELVQSVDIRKNYEKSDLLQIMRLLKLYDLLKDPQMDFLGQIKTK